MKKIAVQELADALELSRVTVWKALNNKPGVAPETARRILEAAHQQAAENAPPLPQPEGHAWVQNVMLLASRMETSSFWMQIVDQLAGELNNRQIRLSYMPLDALHYSGEELPAMLQPGRTDGIIVLNIYSREIISFLAGLAVPKVFLDTVPGHTVADLQGDLVLLEGRGPIQAITEEIFRSGRRRIGFIGDIQYAYTNLLRWEGYLEGMKSCGLPVERDICMTGSIPIKQDDYRERIHEFLQSLPSLPDAFVCVSDFVAFLTMDLLDERRVKVPEDVMLSGYDDAGEFLLRYRGVPTVRVQNGLLGKRLVSQLLYRIENPEADFETIQISPKVIYRE